MLQLRQVLPKINSFEKSVQLLSGRLSACQLESKRGNARGTPTLPQCKFNMNHLKEITGGKYTHRPLNVNRLGGRHPDTGHKINQHVGGGYKFDYFMIDMHRRGPKSSKEVYEERVIEVRRDNNRTPNIALLAGLKGKRWILATENMKAGQIVKTTGYIPQIPVVGSEGNAHPLGALKAGTMINSIEAYPSMDSTYFVATSGSAAMIARHLDNGQVVVRMPHGHEYSFHKECMCTVGKLSNMEGRELQYGSAQMHRRFGYKMSSGLYHKKTGYQGRKIHNAPSVRFVTNIDKYAEQSPRQQFTLTKRQLSGHFGTANVHPLVSQTQFRF